jgi:hypothetical protein
MIQQVRGNDSLVLQDGSLTNVTSLYPVQGGTVYSLMLEETDLEPQIITNGLVTGDFTLQNRTLRESRHKEDKRPIQESEETKQLQKFFGREIG